ncbi:CAP domain-containing protein [Brachyspira alvinipulli]|uniref:CAP domain-containing protein n=1 Tax=Brachyspira alvinipulli TaxID=84379 RepID=UPI0026239077|nr:CAP domain-containing protein [uncultured Brachyspira sp.]
MNLYKSISLILFCLAIFIHPVFSQDNSEADEVFRLINEERKKSGLAEYKTEEQLKNAANQRVREIAGGVSKSTALKDNNIQFSSYSENSIIADMSVNDIFNRILKSSKDLILNKTFTHAAVGVYENNGRKYWVMIYVASRNNDITRDKLDADKERKRVVELANIARKDNGTSSSLILDPTLTEAAQKRAEELIKLFSHTRPNGSQFLTVLKEYNITYNTSGENIANGQVDADDVMKSWLNSPGHRANILNGKFGKIGVGVFEYNNSLYWVQIFTN